ncbi:hypothetical protein ACFZAR_05400 [Streptomyces sp. NPDC008222]|uniref:hypothetical protein n=1 Tax=Streptomyces sp. NPDC008222 TaxID=3364820 RepID=UPI0036EBA214
MTTATKPLPPHGTEYRYRGPKNGAWPGCRCPKCTHANQRAGKVRRLAHLRDEGPLCPGGPIVEHIEKLHDSGMSYALIARRAQVADATITYLVRGITKNCKRDKALRILAVQPADFDRSAQRPAFMSMRRLRALYAIGHNPQAIGAAADLDPSTISHVANGRYQLVEAATDLGVRKAYTKLSTTPGSSTKAKRRAASEGWNGPLAWNDIDDPNEQPEAVADRELNFHQRAQLRREEIIHLAWHGDTPEQIHARLNDGGDEISISTVRQIVQEWRTGVKRDRKQQEKAAKAGLEAAA